MKKVRPAQERGTYDYGWLKTSHTFSFGRYHDPEQMGFSVLRVINEDIVEPGKGFPEHPHDNMEIVTYIVSGQLEHRDSLGNGSVIKSGELQRMSAGTGVTHSEFNPSETEAVHLYQIWILPAEKNIEPSYQERKVVNVNTANDLVRVVSQDANDQELQINQDVSIFGGKLASEKEIQVPVAAGRKAWLQVVKGDLQFDDFALHAGDGLAVWDEPNIAFRTLSESEVLLFDLP